MAIAKYFTYILINKNGTRTYTGSTTNLKLRVEQHNQGKVFTSKAYRPYNLLHKEEFLTLAEAMDREKFYKSTSGRRKMKEIVARWKDINLIGESASPAK